MYSDTDFYSFMGVSPHASLEEIKTRYRKIAIESHPDMGGSEERMRKVNYIYDVLSNDNKRESYDYSRHGSGGKKHTRNSHHRASGEKSERKEPRSPDNYSSAIFVSGTGTRDSKGIKQYVQRGDYIYYPIKKQKKIFGIEYTVNDLYRAEVIKIFSLKKNNFHRPALFVIDLEGLQQIIFLNDFNRNWLNETGYNKLEKEAAYKTASMWALAIFAIFLYLR